jgi:hypothetical protein
VVPFDRLGVGPGGELHFGIQLRNRANAVLESVPHGRYWTLIVPGSGVVGPGSWVV